MARRDSEDLARALLAGAAGDETLIRKVLEDLEIPDPIIGFHAQQAVEKAIKAVLAIRAVSFPKTHALGHLLELLERNGIEGPPQLAKADELAPWAVEFRYGLEDPPTLDRAATLQLVSAITAWAKGVVEGFSKSSFTAPDRPG